MKICRNCGNEFEHDILRVYCSYECRKNDEVRSWRIRRASKLGRIRHKKANTKRQREMGFIPMNDNFNNSEGHHINNNDVIYIPKSWHRSIYHNHNTKQGMDAINTIAFFFLLMQNIDDMRKL